MEMMGRYSEEPAITVHVLQNNERGFPLIFTITVVEYEIIYTIYGE
jgi:hypothetical protein